ncbi:MAG: hypothetical protein ABSD98_16345 [Candidatus Korobacteraceae bacterium]|jgi:hypothetical protein
MNFTRTVLLWCFALLPGTLSSAVPAWVRLPGGDVLAAAQQQSPGQSASPGSEAQNSPDAEGLSLSDQVVRDVLEPLRLGIETQNLEKVLSIFDRKESNNSPDLQGQLQAFFHQYAEVRFRYQVLQVTADNDHGSATAEIAMDAQPYEFSPVPARRSVQMRFQLKLEPKGWKVVGFSPAGFFGLEYSPK